jgi:hypothetical protein
MDSQSAQRPPPAHKSPFANQRIPHQLKQTKQTRTIATSEESETSVRQRCGRKILSSHAESCSAPSPRRRVEDVNNIRLAAVHCARRELWAHDQRSALLPLTHPLSQTNASRISSNKHNKRVPWPTENNASPAFGSDVAARLYLATLRTAVLQVPAVTLKMSTTFEYPLPPAKIASPAFGSDVAARSSRATLRAAVLQVPAVALKMSITLETYIPPSAQGVSYGLMISAASSSPSRIPPRKPTHPASAQTNTTNTYQRHQRRKQVQRSAAMWPQD